MRSPLASLASFARSLAADHIWAWAPLLPGELRLLARRRSQLGWAKFPKPKKRFSTKSEIALFEIRRKFRNGFENTLQTFMKQKTENGLSKKTKSDFSKTKSETEIQNFPKPKTENKFSKCDFLLLISSDKQRLRHNKLIWAANHDDN